MITANDLTMPLVKASQEKTCLKDVSNVIEDFDKGFNVTQCLSLYHDCLADNYILSILCIVQIVIVFMHVNVLTDSAALIVFLFNPFLNLYMLYFPTFKNALLLPFY